MPNLVPYGTFEQIIFESESLMTKTKLKDRDPIAIDPDDRTVIIQHGRKIIRVRRTREKERREADAARKLHERRSVNGS